jgi:polyribonucleotide nucleotidyltransferase
MLEVAGLNFDIVPVGAVLTATVDRINWTRAELRLPGGATSSILSAQVGLRPWAEIGDRLHVGVQLQVRVTGVDKVRRVIEVTPADEGPAPDSRSQPI